MESWRREQIERRDFQVWRCDAGGALEVLCGFAWFAETQNI